MSVTPSLSWREEIPVGEAEAHEAEGCLVRAREERLPTRVTLGDADEHRRNHESHAEEREHTGDDGPLADRHVSECEGREREMGDEARVADVHHADAEGSERDVRLPSDETYE